jgi:hexosaminidase
MPGHSVAALAAYPEYSCTGGPFEVARPPGVCLMMFIAPERKKHFQFLEDVLV